MECREYDACTKVMIQPIAFERYAAGWTCGECPEAVDALLWSVGDGIDWPAARRGRAGPHDERELVSGLFADPSPVEDPPEGPPLDPGAPDDPIVVAMRRALRGEARPSPSNLTPPALSPPGGPGLAPGPAPRSGLVLPGGGVSPGADSGPSIIRGAGPDTPSARRGGPPGPSPAACDAGPQPAGKPAPLSEPSPPDGEVPAPPSPDSSAGVAAPGSERAQIAAILRELRERSGLSQAELARRSGTTPAIIATAEAGRTVPWDDNLVALFQALDAPVEVAAHVGALVATYRAGVRERRTAGWGRAAAARRWALCATEGCDGEGRGDLGMCRRCAGRAGAARSRFVGRGE